jgi:hypothetical protein
MGKIFLSGFFTICKTTGHLIPGRNNLGEDCFHPKNLREMAWAKAFGKNDAPEWRRDNFTRNLC